MAPRRRRRAALGVVLAVLLAWSSSSAASTNIRTIAGGGTQHIGYYNDTDGFHSVAGQFAQILEPTAIVAPDPNSNVFYFLRGSENAQDCVVASVLGWNFADP